MINSACAAADSARGVGARPDFWGSFCRTRSGSAHARLRNVRGFLGWGRHAPGSIGQDPTAALR